MMMGFEIIHTGLLLPFRNAVDAAALEAGCQRAVDDDIPADYFSFYTSVASVYSSKIEGEPVEFDSYFKHRFLKVPFQPDYTKKADDLYAAYEYMNGHALSLTGIQQAHTLLSNSLLPPSQQGRIRSNPMFVINSEDKIEYVAAGPAIVKQEAEKLFADIETALQMQLTATDSFFYAAIIHLTFLKIHPFQDGNGRCARLLEKWFLKEKLGQAATAIQLEKNYYRNLNDYYLNIKKIGLEYPALDYSRALDFLLMTAKYMTGFKA